MEKFKYVNEYIGKQIVRLRKEKGITQEKLADCIGMTRPSVTNIEKGNCRTTTDNIWLICNALNCTPNDLFPKIKPVKTKTVWTTKIVHVPTRVKVRKVTLTKQRSK